MDEFVTIKEVTEETKKNGFVTIYRPIAGWKAIHYWWNDEDNNGQGFWEPWDTSPGMEDNKERAIMYAKGWAIAEEIPYLEQSDNYTGN